MSLQTSLGSAMSMMSSTRITSAYEKQKRTAKNSVQRRSIVDALCSPVRVNMAQSIPDLH